MLGEMAFGSTGVLGRDFEMKRCGKWNTAAELDEGNSLGLSVGLFAECVLKVSFCFSDPSK